MRYLMLLLFIATTQVSAQIDLKGALKGLVDKQEEEPTEQQEAHPSGLGADEMLTGLRQTLTQGVNWAVEQLGAEDGFYANDAVRIPIPEGVESIAKMARKLGQGKYVDALELTLNRAAESAVPATTEIFVDVIGQMTVEDAWQLIDGSDDAVTRYFQDNSESRLREAILPIVRQSTDSAGVSQAYKKLQDTGGSMMSMLGAEDTDLDQHVTDKALDALFLYIAQQERKIRTDPVARTTDLLQSLFGS